MKAASGGAPLRLCSIFNDTSGSSTFYTTEHKHDAQLIAIMRKSEPSLALTEYVGEVSAFLYLLLWTFHEGSGSFCKGTDQSIKEFDFFLIVVSIVSLWLCRDRYQEIDTVYCDRLAFARKACDSCGFMSSRQTLLRPTQSSHVDRIVLSISFCDT